MIVKQRDIPWWQVLIKYSIFEAADSSWSLIIVSTYFGTFLQAVLKERGASFGWAVTLGALVIAILSPVLGASADHTGRRQPYLRVFVSASQFVRLHWHGQTRRPLRYFCLLLLTSAPMVPLLFSQR